MRSINQVLSKRQAPEEKKDEYVEKRFAPRRKDMAPGIVYLEGGSGSFPCFIRDMSTVGAQLELRAGWDNPFSSGVSLNDRIRLVVRMHRVVYMCKIVRRGEKTLGVKFTAAPSPLAPEATKGTTAALAKAAKSVGSPSASKTSGKMPRA